MKKINLWNRLALQGTVVFLIWVVLWETTCYEGDWLLLSAVAAVGQIVVEVIGLFRNFRIEKK